MSTASQHTALAFPHMAVQSNWSWPPYVTSLTPLRLFPSHRLRPPASRSRHSPAFFMRKRVHGEHITQQLEVQPLYPNKKTHSQACLMGTWPRNVENSLSVIQKNSSHPHFWRSHSSGKRNKAGFLFSFLLRDLIVVFVTNKPPHAGISN